MILNGEKTEVGLITVKELLYKKGFNADRVAVELNGEILARDNFDKIIIKNDDIMEVVMFMGGGCR